MTIELITKYFKRFQEMYPELKKWRLKFSEAKRRLGCCRYQPKTIDISFHHLYNGTNEEVLNTLKHEIAHALDYIINHKVGHTSSWKAIARSLGLRNPKATTAVSYQTRTKYDILCPICGVIGGRHQKRQGNYTCRKCGSTVSFRKMF